MDGLNDFLSNYGVELGKDSVTKDLYINTNKLAVSAPLIKIRSGTSISKFPSGNNLFGGSLDNDGNYISKEATLTQKSSVLGLVNKVNFQNNFELVDKEHSGRLAVLTDGYCIDDFQMKENVSKDNCFWLVKSIVKYG